MGIHSKRARHGRDRNRILMSRGYYHLPALPNIFQSDARCRPPTEKTVSMCRKACQCPTTPDKSVQPWIGRLPAEISQLAIPKTLRGGRSSQKCVDLPTARLQTGSGCAWTRRRSPDCSSLPERADSAKAASPRKNFGIWQWSYRAIAGSSTRRQYFALAW